jgi:hypothetical protein
VTITAHPVLDGGNMDDAARLVFSEGQLDFVAREFDVIVRRPRTAVQRCGDVRSGDFVELAHDVLPSF